MSKSPLNNIVITERKSKDKGVLLFLLHKCKLLLIFLTYGNVTASVWQVCSCIPGARIMSISLNKISSTGATIGSTISLRL